MKILDLLKMSSIVLCVTLLAGCNKSDDNSQDQANTNAKASTVSVSAGNSDLSKMTQPCTVDGAKVAGLNAGQGKSKQSNDYAKDNNCTSEQATLNSTYQKYVQNGQQMKGLGIKVGS